MTVDRSRPRRRKRDIVNSPGPKDQFTISPFRDPTSRGVSEKSIVRQPFRCLSTCHLRDALRTRFGSRFTIVSTNRVCCALFRVLDFQRLIDRNGHVIRCELPGQLCSVLRSLSGCVHAEVLRVPRLIRCDSSSGGFERREPLELAIKAISDHVFDLEHLRLPCPPLAVTRGPLEEMLPSEGVG